MRIFSIIQKVFTKLENRLDRSHLNVTKTIYVNFRTLPFLTAIKLPIFIYGRLHFVGGGDIIIKGEVEKGMIKIGRHKDYYTIPGRYSTLILRPGCSVEFNGLCSIARNCILRITEQGKLIFGPLVWIGESVNIDCTNQISIEEGSSITYNTIISDSNHHYVIDMTNQTVKPMSKKISIGKYNWIGNNSYINKGTVTPDNSLVAHGSYLDKDYLNLNGKNESGVLAGAPAKIIGHNRKRIFSGKIQAGIDKYFKINPHSTYYLLPEGIKDESEIIYFK